MSSTGIPSLRKSAHGATRRRLLDAAASLLANGDLPTMRAVANEAGVAERTVYRYFESLDVLRSELQTWLSQRGHVELPQTADELEPYARALFESFEANGALILGLVALATNSLRTEFSKTRTGNLQALRALLRRSYPDVPEEEINAAAASLRSLLSGSGWTYQRISCGLPQKEVIRSVQWAIRRAKDHLASL